MLECENISVSYGERAVLRDISLSLHSSEIVALVGPNGAGKTTLVRTLNGTLTPSSGEVRVNGRRLSEMSRREIAMNISVVAQENETRFPVTVLEFVLSGRFVHGNAFGWETENDIRFARSALAECDLADYEARLMNHLSGGERQRVVLARALAAGTSILLLDEPTANLDLAHQAMMFRLVRKRSAECGNSAVIITHDLNLAAQFSDRVVMLRNGEIKAAGTPEAVLNVKNVRDVFGIDVLMDKNPANDRVRVTALF